MLRYIPSIIKSVTQLGKHGIDFLLPPRCPVCKVKIFDHGHLCASCWGELSPISAPYCKCCGLPFDYQMPGVSHDQSDLCGSCLRSKPEYDCARAAVLYGGVGRRLVLGLKHGRASESAPVMARMMLPEAQAAMRRENINPQDCVFIPVPLHRKRLLLRRFNQAGLLASHMCHMLGGTLDAFALQRIRATASQGDFGRKGRFRNVEGAFHVLKTSAVSDKNIVLVDDVLTTGATVSACALALKRAGAATVIVACFARVPGPEK